MVPALGRVYGINPGRTSALIPASANAINDRETSDQGCVSEKIVQNDPANLRVVPARLNQAKLNKIPDFVLHEMWGIPEKHVFREAEWTTH